MLKSPWDETHERENGSDQNQYSHQLKSDTHGNTFEMKVTGAP